MRRQLNLLTFEFKADNPRDLPAEFVHYGVAASGDMEILMEKKPLDGAVEVLVRTPITGFDEVWRKVLNRFVKDARIGNVAIEINDCNAPPGSRFSQAAPGASGNHVRRFCCLSNGMPCSIRVFCSPMPASGL